MVALLTEELKERKADLEVLRQLVAARQVPVEAFVCATVGRVMSLKSDDMLTNLAKRPPNNMPQGKTRTKHASKVGGRHKYLQTKPVSLSSLLLFRARRNASSSKIACQP